MDFICYDAFTFGIKKGTVSNNSVSVTFSKSYSYYVIITSGENYACVCGPSNGDYKFKNGYSVMTFSKSGNTVSFSSGSYIFNSTNNNVCIIGFG